MYITLPQPCWPVTGATVQDALVVSMAPEGIVAEWVDAHGDTLTRAKQPVSRPASPDQVTAALRAAVSGVQLRHVCDQVSRFGESGVPRPKARTPLITVLPCWAGTPMSRRNGNGKFRAGVVSPSSSACSSAVRVTSSDARFAVTWPTVRAPMMVQ